MPDSPNPSSLRSARWFCGDALNAFRHRSRAMQMGYDLADFGGKPVIAIVNTWSGLNTCHQHFRRRAEEVARGVWQAGGFPVELPAMSLTETYMKPTPMLYRNLLSIETEELLLSQPVDGAALMGGCDKTTPGLLMGAFSANLPCVYLPAGPMLRGNFRGQAIGSGTDMFKALEEYRAGRFCEADLEEMESGIARSDGVCMTMGTASTMTSVVEAMGLSPSGAAAIPAVDASHSRLATRCGRLAVELVREGRRPRDFVTAESFDNAIVAMMALGGSTNAIIHLVAMASRLGIELGLDRFDALSRSTPTLADIRPSGRFLMEDFYYAGGVPALLAEIRDLLRLDCLTVTGQTLGEAIEGARNWNPEVIRPRGNPLYPEGGVAVLRGNLAPDGCVIKASAASPEFLVHRGPALVFSSYEELERRIDDPELPVSEDTVMVLQNAGPLGAPGMPEWGQLPIPKRLLDKGVRDLPRISDARMSGTSYGTCLLHVAPEAFAGGPLALVRDGDMIDIDAPNRSVRIDVSDSELAERKKAWKRPAFFRRRGYLSLFAERVTQADKGCDFDFLGGLSDPPYEPEMRH